MENFWKEREKKLTYERLLFGFTVGQTKIVALFSMFVGSLNGKPTLLIDLPLAKLRSRRGSSWGRILTNLHEGDVWCDLSLILVCDVH